MRCQVCGRPTTLQPGVERRFCSLEHQHHFEDERSRSGLGFLLTRLHAENTTSRRGLPTPELPHKVPARAATPKERSIQILGIADALSELAGRAAEAPPLVEPRVPALDAAAGLVSSINLNRRTDVPFPRVLTPLQMPLAEVRWPLDAGLPFLPGRFCAVPERGAEIPVTACAPPVPPSGELDFCAPPEIEMTIAFDPVEFLGPPPQLPAFEHLPLRRRYYGDLTRCDAPEPAESAVKVNEPEPIAPGSAGTGGIIGTVVTLLRMKGKQ